MEIGGFMESEDAYAIRRGSTSNDNDCLVFLHIPRTAGSTLGTILRRNFPQEQRCVRLNTLDKPFAETLESISLEKRSSLRLVAGHLPYGVHRHIPRPCDYITIMRDPVDRVISVYKLILAKRNHMLHDQVVRSRVSLEQYVESGMDQGQTENSQTRQLSGRQFGVVDATSLDEAKRNLNTFALVGLTERFEETIALLRRTFGLRTSFYLTKNVLPPLEVSQRARELLQERNDLDLELYEFAREVFLGRTHEEGKSFGFEVSALRAWKPVSRIVGGATDRAMRRLKGEPVAKRVVRATRRLTQ
jgi:hypothetical protein